MAEYLNVVYKLALFALAKSVIGDPDIWKVYWMISSATFAISCYCLKLCVERKRVQLTPSQSVVPTNNEKVWFLTATNAIEFLFPLSYLRLAFAYSMELNPVNHSMENNWKTLARGTRIGIDVLAILLPVVSCIEIRNKAQVEDQFVADPPEAVQGDAENQLSVVEKDVKDQSVPESVEDADPQGVPVHVNDVEGQSFADANQPKVAMQTDAENHSVADAAPPRVAIQIDDVENRLEMALQMDVENHSIIDADPSEVTIQIDDVENQPEVALLMNCVIKLRRLYSRVFSEGALSIL